MMKKGFFYQWFQLLAAIFSTIGVIGWTFTEFYGGKFIWLVTYFEFLIPLILLYLYSLFNTLIFFINKREQGNKLIYWVHLIGILSLTGVEIYQAEFWRSERVLEARLNDDLFSYFLILRENGQAEMEVDGFLGFHDVHHGEYLLKEDKLIFTVIPYDKEGFIPDTVLIDLSQEAVFIEKLETGEFDTQKQWLNHFNIELNRLKVE